MRAAHGLTLLEMLMTLAMLGILSSLAVPGFTALRYDTTRTAAVNELLHALFLARSESVKRGTVVSVCKSRDGSSCANSAPDWNIGWMVFVNEDRDEPPQREDQEPIVAVYQGWSSGSITSNRTAYSFRPVTQSPVNGTLVFCDPRGSATARAIIISHTGRPRVAHRDSSNKPLRCAAG
ncbi:MAG TPA: GspH/FimT family protein [Steroidobacteraceae bacterium]|jgi:type IV fimbrial biogenesis protein FimT